MRTLLALPVLLLGCFPAAADEAAASGAHAKALAPYVNDQTFLVVHIDASRLDLGTLARALEMVGAENTDQFKAVVTLGRAALLAAGGKDVYFIMNWPQSIEEVLLV